MDRCLRQPALRAAGRAVRRAVRRRRGALAGPRAVAGPAPLLRASLGRREPRALDRLRHPRRVRHGGPLGAAGRARRPAAVLGSLAVDTAPTRGSRRHLFVGDESALPAIAASLEAVPDRRSRRRGRARRGACRRARAGESRAADRHAGCTDAPRGCPQRTPWSAAVEALALDPDDVRRFVHGDAVETRAVRRHLLGDLGMPRERLSVSPYWRRTFTDESWREVKKSWLAEVEADVPAATERAPSVRAGPPARRGRGRGGR